MKEQPLRIAAGDPAAAVALLKQNGVRVLQRVGHSLIIEGELPPEIAAAVSTTVQIAPVEPLAEVPAQVADEQIAQLAFRQRQTEAFRRSKLQRPNRGESWDKIFERW